MLALAAGAGPLPARQLHAMGRVEHDRATGLAHDGEAAHVGDEIVVAERGAALADHDRLFVDAGAWAALRALSTTFSMSCGAMNCAFLMLTGLPRRRDRMDEIGLAGEEGRRLQHVDDLGDRLDLRNVVDVGQDRHAELVADLGEDAQALVHARAAEALVRRAVGLVEARLEDEQDAELVGDRLQPSRRCAAAAPRFR